MRASMSFHVEVKPPDWARNPAARNPNRLRWKPFHPLARTATSVRAVRASSSRAELEIAVYVKNESFAKPADPTQALALFEGPHASTCRSLLDAPPDCRIGEASVTLGQFGGRKVRWSQWHTDLQPKLPSLHRRGPETLRCLRAPQRPHRPSSLSGSRGGRAMPMEEVLVWDSQTGEPISMLQSGAPLAQLAFSPDEKFHTPDIERSPAPPTRGSAARAPARRRGGGT